MTRKAAPPRAGLSAVDHALLESERLRQIVRGCHEAARRALDTAKAETDPVRMDRYLAAATRLVAMRNALMLEARDVLLAGGRALREAGG